MDPIVILKYFLLFIIAVLLIFKFVPWVSPLFFAKIYSRISRVLNEYFIPHKKQLFKDLPQLTSSDPALRAKGLIRILEIGAGPGMNFSFYPSNTRLIIVEPNDYFSKERKCRFTQAKSDVVIEQDYVAEGENMSFIKDNYVDAVVATMVLCSVHDVRKVLKEIHRVLVPGGKYYFVEHGFGGKDRPYWRVQAIVNPLWKLLFAGCNISRNVITDIRNCNLFENIQHSHVPYPPNGSFTARYTIADSVKGSAQKPTKSEQ